jgi:hypothetical protein
LVKTFLLTLHHCRFVVVSAVAPYGRRIMRLETRPLHVERAVRWPGRKTHRGMACVASRQGRLRRPGRLNPKRLISQRQAAAGALGQASKGLPAFHMACSTTLSLRATATAARLNPRRCTSPNTPSLQGRWTLNPDQQAGRGLEQ